MGNAAEAGQVSVECHSGLLHIRLNRPEKKNALTRESYRRLAEALVDANDNPAVRVIGPGRHRRLLHQRQ